MRRQRNSLTSYHCCTVRIVTKCATKLTSLSPCYTNVCRTVQIHTYKIQSTLLAVMAVMYCITAGKHAWTVCLLCLIVPGSFAGRWHATSCSPETHPEVLAVAFCSQFGLCHMLLNLLVYWRLGEPVQTHLVNNVPLAQSCAHCHFTVLSIPAAFVEVQGCSA